MISRSSIVAAVCSWCALVAPVAHAGVIYDLGIFSFESTGQSMWGSGAAFKKSESVFVGTQWNNKTATIGELVLETGAELKVQTSGKIGLDFGYSIDSGSVDTTADFKLSAELPSTVSAGQFFSITTGNNFASGTIETQSPEIEAYISAILQLSGSVNAIACGTGLGCVSGREQLPNVNLDQRILSIDPGSLKILEGILPSGKPLAEVPIANRSLTLEGGISPVPPYVGIKLTDSSGFSLADTMPDPAPEITIDLVEFELNVPNISTSGSLDDPHYAPFPIPGLPPPSRTPTNIVSNGEDDLLSVQLDIDGIATIFAGLPPAGLNFNLIDADPFKFTVSLDLIDVDAGPALRVYQGFNFRPTLLVDLKFSNPVQIAGMTGMQSDWTGLWSELPKFAISQETMFTPTFWVDAVLENQTGLSLNLVGTLDLLKLGAIASAGSVNLLDFNPISLNDLLRIDRTLFDINLLSFPVFDKRFELSGFNRIIGPSFTLDINQPPVIIPPPEGNPPATVPEPDSIWLLLVGLCILIEHLNSERRRYP